MISRELARRLRTAGLAWHPRDHDRFFIPDRGLDDRVFSISEMTVDVRRGPAGAFIAFNGTVEWALDSIEQGEVVWLPSEAQLREHLGSAFVSLARDAVDRWRVTVRVHGRERTAVAADAAEAYGLALLDLLRTRTPTTV